MKFARLNGGVLELSVAAVSTIRLYLQDRDHRPESGGLLLGRRILNTNDVLVDIATEPTEKDHRSRFRFFRARGPAQAIVDQIWKESGGAVNYLGDWHTHPEPSPTPSCIDRRNWKRIIARCQFEGDSLFFVIAGTSAVRTWEVSRKKLMLDDLGSVSWQRETEPAHAGR